MDDAVRQRIKYLIEHGELYPMEKPAEKSLFVKVTVVIVVLQFFDIYLSIVHLMNR